MIRKLIVAGALVAAMTAPALADPIEGNWKTKSGETAAISACGGSYCVTLKTGKHAGKRIGKMTAKGGGYSGTITDPAKDKTYSGSASISGNTMKMKGCVLGVLCRSENWAKM
ncbi:DUF2147 domain-containing protein [Hoeflea sp. YIM 152468]|uniref:DUF2147 domain-containing protein n=1 Tax=Hoeflea sp. YIM 152468 TaxID=3031759 RepID=UPI0023DB524A|nr:DUF2147 domain-containing protein [Hoeflea sp. YIM 152468]MDF1607656.1 DUF2147 domain-containing protein [Hoeflea sp. YIM 152468]